MNFYWISLSYLDYYAGFGFFFDVTNLLYDDYIFMQYFLS
jgi:hypothetical protein